MSVVVDYLPNGGVIVTGAGGSTSLPPGYARPDLDAAVTAAGGGDLPVPDEVTNFQARAALRRAGRLASVNAALQAAGGEAWDAWEYANTISRHGALVQAMAAQLGMTGAEVDQLFVTAAGIEA